MSNIDTNINNPCNPYKSFIVKASAGSGKTYQLSRRFFYLVLSGADPKNIYTITFTKKAATEMKDRIYKLSSDILNSIPLQQDIIDQMKVFNPNLSLSSYDIISACKKILSTDIDLKISTIDSLFYEWVKLFPYESSLFNQDFFFDIATSLDIKSFKTKAWTLLCESISLSIDKGSFQLEFPYTYSFIKQKGLLSLQSKLDAIDSKSVTNPLFSYELFIWEKLFYDEKVIDSIEPQSSEDEYLNSLGKEFFTLFKIYYSFFTQIKQESNLLTYSDITKGVYTIFNKQEFSSCRYLITSSIHHLLIDEFQDTNKIQWNIFKSISEDILSLRNNSKSEKNTLSTVFFVGDIKQSIYGFREGDPSIMLEAETIFKKYGLTTISLAYNYRSSSNLINYTNGVFSKLFSGFTPSIPASSNNKDFIPNNSSIKVFPLIKEDLPEEELREKEATMIASFIKENIDKLKKSNHTSVSKLDYKDIAILYRQSTGIEIYEKVFQKFSIPLKKESSTTFFKTDEILDLISLIKTILFKNDLSSFSELIKSKIINMSDTDFINILVYNKEKNISSENYQIYIPDYILNNYPELSIILEYQKSFLLFSPYKLIWDLVYKLDIFNKYHLYFSEQYDSIYLNILKFLDLIYSSEQDGISSLIEIYHSLEKKSQDEFTSFQNDTNAVNFMTIHKSKGLEFPVVFLVDSANDWVKKDSNWIKSYKNDKKDTYLYYVGDSKSPDKIKSNAKIDKENETIRLLYVALTRATNHLFISGHVKETDKDKDQNKDKRSNMYKIIEETFNSSYLLYEKTQKYSDSSDISDNNDISTDTNHSLIDPDSYYTQKEDSYLLDLALKNSFLDNITMISPHSLVDTSFKDYKTNINEDIEADINTDTNTNISSKNSSDLNYGTLVHKGMEFYIKNNHITEDILKDISPSYMNTSSIHKAYLEIDNLINSSLFKDLIKDSSLESEFRLCSLKNKIMINGSIDLMIKKNSSNDIIVIDYKTGNFDTIYYNQIKEYKNMVKDLYPTSTVKSYILKTKTLELIEII